MNKSGYIKDNSGNRKAYRVGVYLKIINYEKEN